MPQLLPAVFDIALRPAKTHGLAELGVPMCEATEVKKGKLAEAMQLLGDERIGRRYQNLRATLLKTVEGGRTVAKLVLAFEVFGDDNTATGVPAPVSVRLRAGLETLAEATLGSPFMPFGSCWYENHFAADVDLDVWTKADGVQVVAAADDVRLL